MLIQVRARYNLVPRRGLIRVSKIVKEKPIEYTLCLYNEQVEVQTKKSIFSTIQMAISYASLYGFNSNEWEIETKEI
jgi:hypothetical protein